MAVSNNPYSRTVFERHIVDALKQGAEEGGLQFSDWLSSIQEMSQRCPLISALDLVEVSQKAGYQVEISWAEQHSQRVGLDAIFHRYQRPKGDKVGFRFPVDHQGRTPNTFSNEPLQIQPDDEQRVQEQVYQLLQAHPIPSHLVPEDIVVLPHLPINLKGEVDRDVLDKGGVVGK